MNKIQAAGGQVKIEVVEMKPIQQASHEELHRRFQQIRRPTRLFNVVDAAAVTNFLARRNR